MPIVFERSLCCNFDETISREWLITNSLGGYAAGTVAGTLTRMQHGLLVAALEEDTVPQLLLAKIDEEVLFDQRTYYLGTNEYQDGALNPSGFVHLESFRLEEGFPIFTYRLGGMDGIMLEKRIWMPPEQNTTYIQYRVLRTSAPQATSAGNTPVNWSGRHRPGYSSYTRASRPYGYLGERQPSLLLTLLPLVAHRPYNQPQHGQNDAQFQVQPHPQQTKPLSMEEANTSLSLPPGIAGCTIRARDKQTPYHILAVGHPESSTQFLPTGVWYWHFLHRHDQAVGLPATDDLYLPGVIRARLWPEKDSSLTIIVTTEELTSLPFSQNQISQNYEQAMDHQRSLLQVQSYFGEGGGSLQTLPTLPLTHSAPSPIQSEEFLQLLYQAGNRLLVRRTLPYQDRPGSPAFFFHVAEHIPTIIPGYYQLEDNTREALIALPGLCVATRRYSEAQRMLRYISRYFQQGLLPSRLPLAQRLDLEDEEYNSVDTTLWYFYALDAYLGATHDYELLDEIYPRLVESISWYLQGTYHGIQVDPADGLLRTGSPERALTWMNALVQGKPVTPRTGKAVEVNALWYHALSLMYEWSHTLYQRGRINHTTEIYKEQADLCRCSFNKRFWYQDGGYLYDFIDGPHGNDKSLRPNQLLAGSLRYAVLDTHRHAMVLNLVEQQLVTPYGLRTLAPLDPAYQGRLLQSHAEQQYALHQGGSWPWLIGPYIDAMLNLAEQGSHLSAEATQPGTGSDLCHKEHLWLKGLQLLEPFRQQMQKHLLGSIGDVYDGDTPQNGGPRPASAISVGEILRIYKILAHLGVQHSGLALSV